MNYRKSSQREKILKIIKSSDSHPTADWIYHTLKEEIPGLSLGTVYRNLSVLIEQGHIIKIPFGSSFDRYDGNITPHYHIVCETCGIVRDVDIPLGLVDIRLKGVKCDDFNITGHRLIILGKCETCNKNET
ncbi:Peroxide stress regulator PerR, FUR family [Chitinispirillum alkaliphilum]|nr:Peroxide stress regulator PerR, FUR family [Chitinispirillum alkaliphilum]